MAAETTEKLVTMTITTTRIDSRLGQWTLSQVSPAQFAGLVDQLWHFEGRMTMARERTFPGGYLEVILHLGPRFQFVVDEGSARAKLPVACVNGHQLVPRTIESPGGLCCVLGIRLRPLGAFGVFGPIASTLTDITVDLADLGDSSSKTLAERCNSASTVEERFSLVTQWLRGRLGTGAKAHRAVAWAADQIERSQGRDRIRPLQARSGLSRTRFSEVFRQQVGLSAKEYSGVLRFRHALELVRTGLPLSRVAIVAGYSDQSHMNADFRVLARMTPHEFARSLGYPNSASVAEPS